jgi:deazaflavin-dependent oxidoreductase (nitroreductase family)
MSTGPKDTLLKIRSVLHRRIFAATNGRLLGTWGGLPVVMLTTTGRRTSRPRTTMLASPVQEGDRIVLVASNGGAPRHPDWFLNLRDLPEADVVMRGRRGHMHARIATPEDKDRLWPKVTGRSPSYARYQERTTRDIPLVLLEPAEAATGEPRR